MKKFVVCTNKDPYNLFFMENLIFEKDYYPRKDDFIKTAADIWNNAWQIYITCKIMTEAQVDVLEHTIYY